MKKINREITDERALSIIKKPLMTEKSTNLNQFNQYSFVVSKDCNSNEIKFAILKQAAEIEKEDLVKTRKKNKDVKLPKNF